MTGLLTSYSCWNHAPMAIIPRHMVKEEGRKAGAAMYMAQLPTRRKSVLRPIAGPNFNTTALQRNKQSCMGLHTWLKIFDMHASWNIYRYWKSKFETLDVPNAWHFGAIRNNFKWYIPYLSIRLKVSITCRSRSHTEHMLLPVLLSADKMLSAGRVRYMG